MLQCLAALVAGGPAAGRPGAEQLLKVGRAEALLVRVPLEDDALDLGEEVVAEGALGRAEPLNELLGEILDAGVSVLGPVDPD